MIGEKFKELISEKAREKDSKLILSLDVPENNLKKEKLEEKCLKILKRTSNQITAVKIGYSLVLNAGMDIINRVKKSFDIPIIADFKIADIPYISSKIADYAYKAGADGVITHGFTGRDSLDAIINTAKENKDKGVIVVSNMSHPGSRMFIRPHSDQILNLAKEAGATGLVGPGTRPIEVKALRSKAGEEMMILTPGIGAQGAKPGDAISNGADYEIVGRAIYNSKDPRESAREIRDKINHTLKYR